MTQATRPLPTFRVDPTWPRLPAGQVFGLVSGVTVAPDDDHIWVIHRPRTVLPGQVAAPPVVEFDAAGNYLQGWGGDGEGYEWPGTEHGISIDAEGFVWIGGSGTGSATEPGDDEILKFTRSGQFVLQIGRRGQSRGNTDTENVHGAADAVVYRDEVFVADGYGNRRIIVFDAHTGAYRRMWGAFGNIPTDPAPGEKRGRPEDAPQFDLVHAVRISNDGLVYVSDRRNKRVQVFTPAGEYLTQVLISSGTFAPSTLPGEAFGTPVRELADGLVAGGMTASRTGFSPDAEQQFLYVIDRITQKIQILDRRSLEVLGEFGEGVGTAPGSFYILHDVAVDSQGNAYTAEVNDNGNRRAQKFTFLGMR